MKPVGLNLVSHTTFTPKTVRALIYGGMGDQIVA